ncbi:hypothetical protein HPB51_013651 [Rhipicephalus microplus]|uniref:HTH CENPB-type domain-containing protein n=1 Tax=Rhipicephalus microplus TaxID=6941 RepID=A0A9J6EA34_RHIMP|nr:hypothetical protein HPB51_013651 [Rhipicephalus microplus]
MGRWCGRLPAAVGLLWNALRAVCGGPTREKLLGSAAATAKRCRLRGSAFSDVEEALVKWLTAARSKNLLISGPLLVEKALVFASQLNHDNFVCSNGWPALRKDTALEKRPGSPDSAASTADFVDNTSSEESEDDFGSSDFSSDSESGDDQPGSSTSGPRVSTMYGNDFLPPAQQRIVFAPHRAPGVYITDYVGVALKSGPRKFLTALDFALFFTTQVITMLCENSNKYGWTKILEKPTHARPDGSWEEVTPDEMMKFIGLIIYMGIVKVPRLKLYWNVGELYSGLLPRLNNAQTPLHSVARYAPCCRLGRCEPAIERKTPVRVVAHGACKSSVRELFSAKS